MEVVPAPEDPKLVARRVGSQADAAMLQTFAPCSRSRSHGGRIVRLRGLGGFAALVLRLSTGFDQRRSERAEVLRRPAHLAGVLVQSTRRQGSPWAAALPAPATLHEAREESHAHGSVQNDSGDADDEMPPQTGGEQAVARRDGPNERRNNQQPPVVRQDEETLLREWVGVDVHEPPRNEGRRGLAAGSHEELPGLDPQVRPRRDQREAHEAQGPEHPVDPGRRVPVLVHEPRAMKDQQAIAQDA
mmetsp:Transcript_25747/g.77527  ORF Transcript_25747/g.77527 Transcript_25747/m.77527 type:complete len:245 (-) Transcript_25747:156-890(-)